MITTTDVAGRFRGFLCSTMLEVAPGVFVAPRMSPAVRDRIWDTLSNWYHTEPRGSLVMVWRDLNQTGGIGVSQLGSTPRTLVEADGMYLTRRGAA
jgi:CRISPR-associated protein Cas2